MKAADASVPAMAAIWRQGNRWVIAVEELPEWVLTDMAVDIKEGRGVTLALPNKQEDGTKDLFPITLIMQPKPEAKPAPTEAPAPAPPKASTPAAARVSESEAAMVGCPYEDHPRRYVWLRRAKYNNHPSVAQVSATFGVTGIQADQIIQEVSEAYAAYTGTLPVRADKITDFTGELIQPEPPKAKRKYVMSEAHKAKLAEARRQKAAAKTEKQEALAL